MKENVFLIKESKEPIQANSPQIFRLKKWILIKMIKKLYYKIQKRKKEKEKEKKWWKKKEKEKKNTFCKIWRVNRYGITTNFAEEFYIIFRVKER